MGKLEIVRESLEKKERDGQIVIVKRPEPDSKGFGLTDDGFIWTDTFNYQLAPKKPIYSAEGMNELMMDLVPGIEPSIKNYFRVVPSRYLFNKIRISDGRLVFGNISFKEKIGEVRNIEETITTITDEELLRTMGREFADGKVFVHEDEGYDVHKVVFIEPFPDERIARNEAYRHIISFNDMKRYGKLK